MSRRTKIVCTLGPASASAERIEQLIAAGMDCARLNFSHGRREEHRQRFEAVRAAARRAGRPVAILQDLQGPKIRVGRLPEEGILLEPGEPLVITTDADAPGQPGRVGTTYAALPDDVNPGDRLLLDDGLLELEVVRVAGREVHTRVVIGGILKSHKGINLPGVKVSAPALTEKDREDLAFGLELGVDFVALSFVRDPRDLEEARAFIERHPSGRRPPLIAKLEKPEAVEKLDAIVEAADGLMVARGDLGVEMRPERVPLIQKQAIERTNARGKIVITATQMLDSMIHNPRPTRAEASDVANAVLDGTDAVMLSGETAAGRYSVESVAMMADIIQVVEKSERYRAGLAHVRVDTARDFRRAIALAAVAAARDLQVEAIACYTQSGATAEVLSEQRPTAPIVALTPDERVLNRLALHWGVIPIQVALQSSTDEMLRQVERVVLERGLARVGSAVVITLGAPGGNDSNLCLLHRIGSRA